MSVGPWWCFVCSPNAPAIWLYPQAETDLEVTLNFHEGGFMVRSIPDYNQGWRIHVNPEMPFNKYSETYGSGPSYAYLDYDGFRAGPFQRERGWCIPQSELLLWQREKLAELGFTQAEIDDVNYSYGRILLERQYPEPFFAVYPQDKAIVDASVSLQVFPEPDTVYRLWLYFVPISEPIALREPRLSSVSRSGFTAVELGFLSDLEIPQAVPEQLSHRVAALDSMVGSPRFKPLK
jgi:hypothetical protein